MATQMDLLNQHLVDMEAKMNEMIKLVEQEADMTNGTQKNSVWLNELMKNMVNSEAQKLKEKLLVIKETEVSRHENEVRNMEMELGKLKTEKDEAALQNESLQLEVDELLKKLAIKDQELLKKEEEMEKLQNSFGQGQSSFPSESSQEDLFSKLSEDCIMKIISLTSPQDACRLSLIGTNFKSAADSNAVWEAFMGDDHKMEIIFKSMQLLPPVLTAKDLFLQLADKPILFDHGTKSFSIDKCTAQKSYMLGARSLQIGGIDNRQGLWKFICIEESRFPEVVELSSICWLGIRGQISKKLLSRNTLYETYLVFNLTPDAYGFENQPMEVSWGSGEEDSEYEIQTIFLEHTFINNIMENEPMERSDGWKEIKMGDYFNEEDVNGCLFMEILELYGGRHKGGLVVEGIEIRPIK